MADVKEKVTIYEIAPQFGQKNADPSLGYALSNHILEVSRALTASVLRNAGVTPAAPMGAPSKWRRLLSG